MLQNCYKLHTFVTIAGDVKSGRFSTVSDNVQDGKKSTRKYIVKSGARNDIQDPYGRAGSQACGRPSLAIYARGELEAGSCYNELGSVTCAGQAGKKKEEEKIMKFYVVDQWGQYINEFEDREDAERFCDKWNKVLRFNEWSEPKAHIVEGE